MPPDAKDSDLIERVLAGEGECFAVLVRRHASPLWATLRDSTRNLEDAREVFQETWLRAFERLSSLREPARLRAWLLGIGLNLVRERHRRPGPVGGLDEDLLPPGDEPHVGARLEAQEELSGLQRSLGALPPRQRQVMDLRLNHELSHAEIALELSISEESSRASYYQALRRLRAELAPGEARPTRQDSSPRSEG